jgi:hypothetical protein
MQKFAFILLAVLATLMMLAPRAEGAAIAEKRETNAERFARGMNPLPPTKRSDSTSK